jgi:hypothetical protein
MKKKLNYIVLPINKYLLTKIQIKYTAALRERFRADLV